MIVYVIKKGRQYMNYDAHGCPHYENFKRAHFFENKNELPSWLQTDEKIHRVEIKDMGEVKG